MVNPEKAELHHLQAKVRYTCPSCKHIWTSGLGQFAAIIDQKRVRRGCYAINFRVLAYTHDCKNCQVRGEVKPYEDELERISTIIARESLQSFGFTYDKEDKPAKKCRPRSKHLSNLCQACRVGVCPQRRGRRGKKGE